MTKAQWRELILRNLGGGDSPSELRSRYHEREIELYLGIAFDTIMNRKLTQKQELESEMGMNAWRYDALTKTFVLDILNDTVRNRRYSVLPASVLSITNNDGIRMITPTQEESTAFLPRRIVDTFLMDGLDVGTITGLIFFSLEGNKIYYSGSMDCNWRQVLAKLALRFNEFEDNDEINLPEGQDAELVQITLSLLQQKRPMDITNDDTAIQTTQ